MLGNGPTDEWTIRYEGEMTERLTSKTAKVVIPYPTLPYPTLHAVIHSCIHASMDSPGHFIALHYTTTYHVP